MCQNLHFAILNIFFYDNWWNLFLRVHSNLKNFNNEPEFVSLAICSQYNWKLKFYVQIINFHFSFIVPLPLIWKNGHKYDFWVWSCCNLRPYKYTCHCDGGFNAILGLPKQVFLKQLLSDSKWWMMKPNCSWNFIVLCVCAHAFVFW